MAINSFTNVFKKHYKKAKKQGKDLNLLKTTIYKLANLESLDINYKNHHLINDKNYSDCMECHLEPDWLLIYRYNDNKLILIIIATGSHSDLFKK